MSRKGLAQQNTIRLLKIIFALDIFVILYDFFVRGYFFVPAVTVFSLICRNAIESYRNTL